VKGRRGRALTWYVTAGEGVKRLTLFYEGTTVNAELDSCRDWQARLSLSTSFSVGFLLTN